jgi:hypothetical protein
MHEDMNHVSDAFPTGIDDATHSSPAHLRELYSPECVEGEFSEVILPLYGVLGSTHRGAPESVSKNLQGPLRNASGNARETLVL